MKISREDVLRVAELAHLELSPEEIETYRGQLDEILTYIDKLKELDVANVEPMAQVLFTSHATPAEEKRATRSFGTMCCAPAMHPKRSWPKRRTPQNPSSGSPR